MSYIIIYHQDLPRLIGENSSSYMKKNKVKSFFSLVIGASEKSAGIRKIRNKAIFLSCTEGLHPHYPLGPDMVKK